ncbi:MutS-related protein [Marivirga sp.]|uniref:MutS-related protein n=1 Tax=Marivirga sp. TaxID=2018662 RepID=UPI003DA6D4D4
MSIATKSEFYSQKINQFQNEVEKNRKLTNQFGTIRVLYFLATIVVSVYFINERNGLATTFVLLPFPLIFGWLVNRHKSKKRLLTLARNRIIILNEEIDRLNLKLDKLPKGERFIDGLHEYAPDMDVFGRHSVFSLVNRSALNFGQESLAKWFNSPATKKEISARQQAVEEIKSDFDWRLEWWAESRIKENKKEEENLTGLFDFFSKAKEEKIKSIFKYIPFIAIFQLAIFFILSLLGILPWSFVGLGFLINILLLLPIQGRIMRLQSETEQIAVHLEQHKNLFKMAEEKQVSAPFFKELQSHFQNPKASQKINSLSKILNWMHARAGMMYWVINPFLLIDYWVLNNIVKWKNQYGKLIEGWFSAIGDWEALMSMADFAFSHEDYMPAKISNAKCELKAKDLGHPLLPHDERVCNDFEMTGPGAVTLITGANMSGKSTFERSLGVNMILAQMGAVCCVESLELSPLQLFTSMRTQDNLEENTSSFYAELKRLKQLVDMTKVPQERPIFYLLDEILKGTNSEDRNIGAESLIRQLMKTNSMGLVSTHDLSLAKLEDELDNFQNYSFNSDVSGEEILFDYKLHNAPCHTFNAVPLMRKMGIEIIKNG